MVREQLNGLDDNEQSMIWHPLIAKAIGELYNSGAVEIPKVNNERTGLVHVYRPIIRDRDTVESTMEELTIKLQIEAEMLKGDADA